MPGSATSRSRSARPVDSSVGAESRFTADPRTLNLYYRLAHDALGHGYGRELVGAIIAAASEELPDHTVRATVKRHNHASMATALGAGLVEVGERRRPEDGPDDPPSVVLELRPMTAARTVTGSC